MNSLLRFGVTRLFSGARQGRPGIAGLGAALGIIGFLQSRKGASEELVYKQILKPGETLRIRLAPDGAETKVEG